MSHKFEKRCEARQSEIRAGSVLAHVTKQIAAITPPRVLVVLRFLLNSTEETDCFWPNPTTLCYLTNYIRSTETGEIFRLDPGGSQRGEPSRSVSTFNLGGRGYIRAALVKPNTSACPDGFHKHDLAWHDIGDIALRTK